MNNKPTRIFLIIGLTKESTHWDDTFLKTIKEKFKTNDIIAIDLPGSGKYLDQKSPMNLKRIVRNTRLNYKKCFKDDTNNILISISLGGMVGTAWLEQFPDDFDKFVIINSSLKNYSSIYKRTLPWAMKRLFGVFFASTPENKEHKVLELCSNNSEVYDHVKTKWVKIAKERPMGRINMVKQILAGATYNSNYKPNLPLLIIAARHDKIVHYSCSENLHKNWGGNLQMIEGDHIGHAAHIDAPVELATIIYDWAKKQANS